MAATPQGRQWWQSAWLMLAVISLAVGMLAGAAVALYAHSRTPTYESSAVLLIDQQPAVFQTGDEGLLGKLSRLRYKYVGLVHTEAFARPVADDAGLPLPVVQGGLFATANPDNLLIVVTASLHDAADARQVAQLAADHLVDYIENEQFDAKVPANEQVSLSVVNAATPPVQTEPSTKKVVLEALITFLAITVAGAVGADLLRRRA